MGNIEENTLKVMGGSNLNHALEYHLRAATKAGKAHRVYVETGCDRLMQFGQFKAQGVRNKLLKQYGRDPIYLSGESRPHTVN